MPSYRLREAQEAAARKATEGMQSQIAEYQRQMQLMKTQMATLTGLNPPANPQDQQTEAIRKQFSALFPGLAKFEERAGDIDSLLQRAADLDSQTQHYWQTYGRQQMNRLYESATKDLGGNISEEAKRALHAGFIGFVQSSPELSERYANDPSLVDEYWQTLRASLIDPVRRSAGATVATRAAGGAATPQDTPGGGPVVSQAPKPKDLDERAAMGWQVYQQNKKG